MVAVLIYEDNNDSMKLDISSTRPKHKKGIKSNKLRAPTN